MADLARPTAHAVRQQVEQQRREIQRLLEECAAGLGTRLEADERRRHAATYLTNLVSGTAAVCNDLLALRQGDAWAVALAYLANYSVAQFATALAAGQMETAGAMVANLRTMADALDQTFPDGRHTVAELRRALAPFDSMTAPKATLDEPHPFVDTLARQVQIIRDTGYRLAGFREFFAASERGVHAIRPA